MSVPGFPSIFYSKDPLPTNTILIKNVNEIEKKKPKIILSTRVVDIVEQEITSNSKNTLAPYYDNDGIVLMH